MKIHFQTDGSVTLSGFKIRWEVVEPNPCGGHSRQTEATSDKTMKSINYPNLYDDSMNCEWRIDVPSGKSIQLEFEDFELEGPASNCPYDYLSLNGQKSCGVDTPTTTVFENSLTIHFRTDGSVTRKGFKLKGPPQTRIFPQISVFHRIFFHRFGAK